MEIGRDRVGTEATEYCESLFFEACDMGRESVVRRAGVVAIGGRVAVAALPGENEPSAGGEVAGDEAADMTAVVVMPLSATVGDATRVEYRSRRGACNDR